MKPGPKIIIALLLILSLGLFMRAYQAVPRFMYNHDNDLASWIVKDMLRDGHIRLVGQLTSAPGIYIGPLFYYLITPFYVVTGFDPVGSLAYSWFIGIISIVSVFYVLRKLYNFPAAAIGSLLYAGSWGLAVTERDVVPTTPVMLWSVWFFYAVNLIFQGKKSGLYLAAVLLALVWHLNLALIVLSPLIIFGVWYQRRQFRFPDLARPALLCLILSLPLITFEVKHHFIQFHALLSTLSGLGSSHGQPIINKVSHVITYALKNANALFWEIPSGILPSFMPALILIMFCFLLASAAIPMYTSVIIFFWFAFYILFFTLHPINLSEYYLNGMNIIWFIGVALFLGNLYRRYSIGRLIVPLIMLVFVLLNLRLFLISHINASGYLERQALVNAIASDAAAHNYPCVAVSYMVDPGYNLGYRYFFYLKNLKVLASNSMAPVYTIVFPHTRAGRLDQTFGALGLVLPDYNRYNSEGIAHSCSGLNSNLTDPMFGFTN